MPKHLVIALHLVLDLLVAVRAVGQEEQIDNLQERLLDETCFHSVLESKDTDLSVIEQEEDPLSEERKRERQMHLLHYYLSRMEGLNKEQVQGWVHSIEKAVWGWENSYNRSQ